MRRLLLALLLPACTLYGDDAPADDTCDTVYVPYELVNPSDLTCQDFGSYACAEFLVPIPTWGECDSPCRALDEASCLGSPGCRATYDEACYTGNDVCEALIPFLGCYPVDQSGPVQGDCANLDAQGCSAHDDCIALYQSGDGPQFSECISEMR